MQELLYSVFSCQVKRPGSEELLSLLKGSTDIATFRLGSKNWFTFKAAFSVFDGFIQ